jgi:outer membrane receptor for ferrienterochelin and colicins
VDNSNSKAWTYSAYLQDSWKLLDSVTVNYGLRFDQLKAFRSENQLSPRANVVWIPQHGTTIHAGYARYFTPPPFELVASQTIARFAGTSAEAPGKGNNIPRSERDDYYDIGVEKKVAVGLTVGADAYYKKAKNLIDEGQFGAPIILTPFNYAEGYAEGVELSANYAHGPLSAYANLAWSRAEGRNIVTSQFNFAPAVLAYIQQHYIHLDHDQTYTLSGGASYRLGATRVSGDLIYGSGLRSTPLGRAPNSGHLAGYTQVNLSVSHEFEMAGGPLTLKADLINALDEKYEIRDGSGIGVGNPQFGPRQGLFLGATKAF